MSQASSVVRAPARVASRPLKMPKIPIAAISATTTQLIRVADPVVTSTNHGIATADICVPVVETISAASSATTVRLRRITAR